MIQNKYVHMRSDQDHKMCNVFRLATGKSGYIGFGGVELKSVMLHYHEYRENIEFSLQRKNCKTATSHSLAAHRSDIKYNNVVAFVQIFILFAVKKIDKI